MKLRAVFILIWTAAGLVWSQEFDVASIKPTTSDPAVRPRIACTGGRLAATNIPAQFLIEYAYNIRDTFPLPDWARPDGDKYDVEAKADSSVTAQTCKLMTQHLLEDRFQLQLRKEIREANVYFLTIAKGGPKLKTGGSEGVWWNGRRGGPGMRMSTLAVSLTDLQDVGRRVVDKTGLPPDVMYQFRLDFTSAEGGPDIFAAVESQAGLKLVQGKAPVESVVVDRISKPTAN